MSHHPVRFVSRTTLVLTLILFMLFVVAAPARGSSPGAAPIKAIQVNQVLGAHASKFVAGKDTVVRVLLNGPVTPKAADQQVVVKRNGQKVATLSPSPSDRPVDVLEFACRSRAACGEWQAGKYVFEATVSGTTASAGAEFVERRPLKILAVPVKANYDGDVRVPNARWKKLGEFMKQVYPIAPAGFQWTLGQELDASDDEYDLETEEGQRQLWDALAALQPQGCTANPHARGCYELIIGFVKDRQGEDGTTQGFTFGAPANVVTESDQDAAATVAHEVAHVFGIGDEYDEMGGVFNCAANRPPPKFVGRDWDNTDNANFRCDLSTAVPFAGGSGSAVKAAVDFPYEVGGRGALGDMMSFMGTSAKQEENWTTPDIWSWLFDQLAPGKTTAMLHTAALPAPIRYVAAFGYIGKDDQVTVDPWYSFTDTVRLADARGKVYTLQAVDVMSQTLASRPLDVDFVVHSNPPRSVDVAPFEQAIAFPDGTAAFRILKGNTVLKVIPVSPHTPEVEILAPKANETIAGAYTIRWTGRDQNGDLLRYTVEYSDNGEDWLTLADEITGTEWTEDFAEIAGSREMTGRIRVTATDGVNATEVTSALFSVPPKAPEVFIEEPANDAIFEPGDQVAFSGGAYDLQDEWLTEDEELVWSSDLQGELGRGEILFVDDLKPGKHTITLQGTNSLNLTSSATIVLTIQ